MSTTSTHDTQIIVDPDVPLVRIVREFDAAPDKVFRAHAGVSPTASRWSAWSWKTSARIAPGSP